MIYQIDGTAVNDRTDWFHQLNPVTTGRTEYRFPGLGDAYVTKDPALPPQLVIEGYLEGSGESPQAACDALIAKVYGWIKQSGDAVLRSVTVHGTTFVQCELVSVVTLERVEAVAVAEEDADPYRVRQRVRFLWRPLSASAVTLAGGGGA